MNPIAILTDSSFQLPRPTFTGRNLIQVIPFQLKLDGRLISEDTAFRVHSLPLTVGIRNTVEVTPPTYADLVNHVTELADNNRTIIVILLSAKLSPLFDLVERALTSIKGKAQVHLIDSQTTGLGLGYLVQKAAELAIKGASPTEIEYQIRGYIPRIYTQMCTPNITYLHKSGLVDKPQALVGEMLNVLPVYTIEDGHMVSTEKVKNQRHLVDSFQEFIDEFTDLECIAVAQSTPPLIVEVKTLRDHSNMVFPGVPFIEHAGNLTQACLFGPKSIAVYAIESNSN